MTTVTCNQSYQSCQGGRINPIITYRKSVKPPHPNLTKAINQQSSQTANQSNSQTTKQSINQSVNQSKMQFLPNVQSQLPYRKKRSQWRKSTIGESHALRFLRFASCRRTNGPK
nr:PREDICTED: uncharacterized protein LOC105662808 [Megachile rotundata]